MSSCHLVSPSRDGWCLLRCLRCGMHESLRVSWNRPQRQDLSVVCVNAVLTGDLQLSIGALVVVNLPADLSRAAPDHGVAVDHDETRHDEAGAEDERECFVRRGAVVAAVTVLIQPTDACRQHTDNTGTLSKPDRQNRKRQNYPTTRTITLTQTLILN